MCGGDERDRGGQRGGGQGGLLGEPLQRMSQRAVSALQSFSEAVGVASANSWA